MKLISERYGIEDFQDCWFNSSPFWLFIIHGYWVEAIVVRLPGVNLFRAYN